MGNKAKETEPPPIDWPPCGDGWKSNYPEMALAKMVVKHFMNTVTDIQTTAVMFNLHPITVEKILRTEALIGMEKMT